jgi:hypothetical protein
LILLAGIKRKIGAQYSSEPGLESIAGDRKGRDMELAFFLLDRIDPSRVVALKEGAAKVDQIKLIIRIVQTVLCCCPDTGQCQKGYEQVCKYASDHRVSGFDIGLAKIKNA